jgi:hypothetical protein
MIMKYTIIALLMFTSYFAFGQTDSTIFSPGDIIMTGPSPYPFNNPIKVLDHTVFYDTAAIILQYSDTSDHDLHWMKGYEVSEVSFRYGSPPPNADGTINASLVARKYYTHVAYLNENKQPLSKNIIVWQSH